METTGTGVLVGAVAATLYVALIVLRHRRSGFPEAVARTFLTWTPRQLLEISEPCDVAAVVGARRGRELFLVEGGEFDGVVLAVRPVRGDDDRVDVVMLGTDGVMAIPPGVPDDGTASLAQLVEATEGLPLRSVADGSVARAIWASELRRWPET